MSAARTMLRGQQRVDVHSVHIKPLEHGLQGGQRILQRRAAAWKNGTERSVSSRPSNRA